MLTNELEITWKRALVIWWAMLWRGFIYIMASFGISVLIGMTLGKIIEMEKQQMNQVIVIIWIVSVIPIYFITCKMAVTVKYKEFRIALLPIEKANQI